MKLKSGREVKLKDLTQAQREECEDAIQFRQYKDGSTGILGLNKGKGLWCQYGLGLENRESLLEYSEDDLNEIMIEVKERTNRGVNPTKSAS